MYVAGDTFGALEGSNAGGTDAFVARLNERPVASFIFCPAHPVVGEAAAFDASSSTEDDPIVSYGWTFGEGSAGAGRKIAHVFPAPGTYTATLVVTDESGLTDSTSRDVIVSTALSVTAWAGAPPGLAPSTVPFHAVASGGALHGGVEIAGELSEFPLASHQSWLTNVLHLARARVATPWPHSFMVVHTEGCAGRAKMSGVRA